GRVRVAAFDQLPDHGHDLADVGGGLRLDVRRRHAERGHVLAVGGGEAAGDVGDRHPGLARGGVDLVVDVGDVARVAQRAEAAAQQVGEHAEHHRTAGVADVHVVVDRRPAYVHGRAGRVGGRERFDAAGQAVVKAQAHVDVTLRVSGFYRPRGDHDSAGSAAAGAQRLNSRGDPVLPGQMPQSFLSSSFVLCAVLAAAGVAAAQEVEEVPEPPQAA